MVNFALVYRNCSCTRCRTETEQKLSQNLTCGWLSNNCLHKQGFPSNPFYPHYVGFYCYWYDWRHRSLVIQGNIQLLRRDVPYYALFCVPFVFIFCPGWMLIISAGDYILIIDQHIEGVLSRVFYVFNVSATTFHPFRIEFMSIDYTFLPNLYSFFLILFPISSASRMSCDIDVSPTPLPTVFNGPAVNKLSQVKASVYRL